MKKITSRNAKVFLLMCIAVLSSAGVYEAFAACSVTFSPQPSNQTACAGSNATFSLSANSPGCSITGYQWQTWNGSSWVNISAPGSNPTYSNYTTNTLNLTGVVIGNNGNQYRCVVTCGGGGGCGSGTPFNSNAVTLTVNPLPTVVTVTAPSGGPFCGSVVLTATGGTGGTIYWQNLTPNGINTATPSSTQTVSASNTYYFRARTAAGCWGAQGSINVSILPSAAPPALHIEARSFCCGPLGDNITVCQFQNITFNVDSIFGEASENKRFKWKKNGAVVDSSTVSTNYGPPGIQYSTANLATGDVITLTIVWQQPPGGTCYGDSITSQPITLTVTPNQPPTAFITASPLPADTICRGSQVTYTANVADAGTPRYLWYLDGAPQVTDTFVTYTTSAVLVSGTHTIWCRVTSNQACDLLDPVFSQVVVTTPMILVVNPCYYYIPVSGVLGPFYSCGSPFYDSQNDLSVNYANSVNGVTKLCPATAGQYVTLSFTAMNLADANDRLRIFGGSPASTITTDTNGAVLLSFTGPISSLSTCAASNSVTSNVSGGCLTSHFRSDATGNGAGWIANVSCSTSPSPGPLPGVTCATPTLITALPYTVSGHTTQCYGNDYGVASCNATNYQGDDHIYEYTATGPECTSITLSGVTGVPVLAVYLGCPPGGTCITPTPQVGNSVAQVTLPSAGTYYIVVDETSTGYSSYNLDIQTFGLAPANDLPCNAQYIDLLVNVNGNNYCTGSAGEPAAVPSCWTGGTMNTLWYSFTSPATPNPSAVHIRTTPGTIISTQIALYEGSCGALTLVSGNNCNQMGPNCASTSNPPSSDLIYTNLTPNTIYYIRVDGRNNNTGNFNIIVADNNPATPQPLADGQDCLVPMTICAPVFTVGDPGFLWTGWVCDFGTSNNTCMFAGERSSAWYVFTTNGTGSLGWRLTPNGSTYVDYDWLLLDITSFGSDQASRIVGACPQINANNLPVVRCNISDVILYSACASSQYQTGMCPSSSYTTTTAFGPSFCSSLNVSPNQTFLLQLSNWTQNQRGFTMDFNAFGASPIAYQNPPSVLYWTAGANNTDWFNPVNWGNCGPPTCGTTAIITTGSTYMPVINTNTDPSGIAICRDLDIKSGATVTINGGVELDICRNFVNNGSLIAAPSSTVVVKGSPAQYFDGNMIGSSKFGNLQMDKPSTAASFNMTILDNAQVGGNLMLPTTFGGRIITGPKTLYITNPAPGASTFGGAQSFVQGNLRRNLSGAAGQYFFPVGYAAPYNWQLAKVDFTAAHTIPNILSFFTPWSALPGAINTTDPACNWNYNATPAFLDNGYWTMTASANPSSATYDMTLYNLNATNAFAPVSGFTVMKAATIAGPWALNGTCFAGSTFAQTKRTSMTGFSVFATGQTNNPLPITLLSFDAVAHGTGVMTTWVTAAEVNNDYFVIERSVDGVNFEEVGTRKGAGNSTATLYYSMLDLQPHKGVSYYRLRQFDFDGANTKSELVAVSFLTDNVLTVFPNPANTGVINMSFISAGAGDVKLEIIDMLGKVLLSQMLKVSKGQNDIRDYNIRALPQGVYFVQLKPTGSEIIEPMQTRLVKQIREE